MAGYGYNQTGGQCREHIKKLKKDFKKTKDNSMQTSGNCRKQYKFFNKLNEILGKWPSIKPAVVIGSKYRKCGMTSGVMDKLTFITAQ